MTARTTTRTLMAGGCILTSLVLVTGCSGSSSTKAESKKSATPTVSTAAPQPTFKPIPTLTKQVGARKDATVSSCSKSGSGWVAKGTVTNASSTSADYVIVVSLLDGKGGTKGINWTRKDGVGSKDKAAWQVAIPVKATGLSCVLRVTRGSAS